MIWDEIKQSPKTKNLMIQMATSKEFLAILVDAHEPIELLTQQGILILMIGFMINLWLQMLHVIIIIFSCLGQVT